MFFTNIYYIFAQILNNISKIKLKSRMKKLVFAFLATVAMTFAACGGQTAGTASTVDSDSVAVDTLDTVVVDSVVVADSVIAE